MKNIIRILLICFAFTVVSLTICSCEFIGTKDEQAPVEPPVINETVYKDLAVQDYSDPAPEYNTYGGITVDGIVGDEWKDQQTMVNEAYVKGILHRVEMSTSFADEGIVLYAKVTGAPAYYNPLRFTVNTSIGFYIETDAEPTDNEGPMKIILYPGELYLAFRYDKRGEKSSFSYNRYHVELDRAYTVDGKINDPTNNGYTIECMIPWSAIGESAAPDKVYINPEISYCANETDYSSTGCSLVTYLRGDVASHTDWYKFDEGGYQICTDGHTFGSYKIAIAPTSDAAGEAFLCCDKCLYLSQVNMPAVSETNGYTKLVSGVATIWKYTTNDSDIIFAIENSGVVTKETAFMVKDNDPFAEENGGSIVGNIDKSNDGLHYENNFGNTFNAKVYSSEDTSVKLIIKVASADGRVAGLKGLFSSLTVNGEPVVINEGNVTGAGWGSPVNAVVALVSLKEGENTISFTRTSNTGSGNNFNVWGIGFIAANDIIIDLDPISEETLKTQNFIAFINDPFIAANGGSISGTVSVTNDVPRYQKTQGQTFTATITVSSDTVANFIIKVENGSKTNTYKGLFSSITLDGAAVTINDGSVTGKGWGNSIDIVVASLNLTKGTHVITFTRTSSTATNNNFNIWGIGFIIPNKIDITLGSAE